MREVMIIKLLINYISILQNLVHRQLSVQKSAIYSKSYQLIVSYFPLYPFFLLLDLFYLCTFSLIVVTVLLSHKHNKTIFLAGHYNENLTLCI